MIWNIFKKQGLLILRNPQQLVLMIAFPILLITILSAALGSWMGGDSSPIAIKIAFLEHEDEQKQVDRFLEEIKNQLPPEAVNEIRSNVDQMMPIKQLKETILENEKLSDLLKVDYIDPSERENVVEDDMYTSLIEVPENFTYDILGSFVLNKAEQPTLIITQNEGKEIGAKVVREFITEFQKQLTLGKFLGENHIDITSLNLDTEAVKGEIQSINELKPVSAKAYYTIGMALMNILYLASAIGSYAYREKTLHVFDRIMMANVSRWVYFSGVLLATTTFAFIQAIIIFTFSRFIFGVTWPDIMAFLLVTIAFSMAVGGIGVLLVSISFRINSETITNFFSNIIVIVFAVLGGSFSPIGDFSKVIQFLGNLTPNGASMTAYLGILRGEGLASIGNEMLYLISFAVIAVIIASLCFPKRRVSL